MDLSQTQCRASPITSAKLGVGRRRPLKRSHPATKWARATAQTIIALHLRVHADRACPHNESETPRTNQIAEELCCSEEKRPPTSPSHLCLRLQGTCLLVSGVFGARSPRVPRPGSAVAANGTVLCPPRLGTLSSKVEKTHPKTLSSKTISSNTEDNFIHDTFIQKRVHPMTLSSKNGFVQ